MLDDIFNPLELFVQEESYLGKLSKIFWYARREKKMGLLLKTYKKKKSWRENNRECRTLKYSATKADTKLEEAYDYKTVFSDLTFTVAADPS